MVDVTIIFTLLLREFSQLMTGLRCEDGMKTSVHGQLDDYRLLKEDSIEYLAYRNVRI